MIHIAGVAIENPTAVWMQLMNTRRNVLNNPTKWNSGAWYDRPSGTMCLGNALRYVVRGKADRPTEFGGNMEAYDKAEMLVLQAANRKYGEGVPRWDSIPGFNDHSYRSFHEIIDVLDQAIKWVEPHAKTHAIAISDDVMTKKEKSEVEAEIRRIEDEMFQERWGSTIGDFRKWLADHEARGWSAFWDELLGREEKQDEQETALVA